MTSKMQIQHYLLSTIFALIVWYFMFCDCLVSLKWCCLQISFILYFVLFFKLSLCHLCHYFFQVHPKVHWTSLQDLWHWNLDHTMYVIAYISVLVFAFVIQSLNFATPATVWLGHIVVNLCWNDFEQVKINIPSYSYFSIAKNSYLVMWIHKIAKTILVHNEVLFVLFSFVWGIG